MNFIAVTLALNHLGRCHISDLNFHALCGIYGFPKTHKKCVSFRNHISRKHGDLLLAEKDGETLEQMNDNSSDSEMEMDTNENGMELMDTNEGSGGESYFVRESEEIRRTGALYLLKIKDKDRASQAAIDSFIENTTYRVKITPPT